MPTDSDPHALEQVSQIIDSSALIKYVSKEDDWIRVEKHIATADSLELAIIETANALWKKIRKKEVDYESAKIIIQTLYDSIWLFDQRKYLNRAFEIATQFHITVYDSLFLACAENERGDLVSCDEKQIEVADDLGIKTISV